MSAAENGQALPYRERNIPDIILLAQSYFGEVAVAYGLEDDTKPSKLEVYASGLVAPNALDEKRLRDLAEIIEIHKSRKMSPLDSVSVMINRKAALDNMVPWDVIRIGESERVVAAMPGMLERYVYGNGF